MHRFSRTIVEITSESVCSSSSNHQQSTCFPLSSGRAQHPSNLCELLCRSSDVDLGVGIHYRVGDQDELVVVRDEDDVN